MKKYMFADFCADKIDVITNFAVITNVVITGVSLYTLYGETLKIISVISVTPSYINHRKTNQTIWH